MQTPVEMTQGWLARLRPLLPPDIRVYLVGGAVRDLLLQRPVHDLDFVVSAGALKLARQVANRLGGAFYALDETRETGRVIFAQEDGTHQVFDFALLRGDDLESDLRGRDFTINAMALDVHTDQVLIDPLGGALDLQAKRVRACAPTAFEADPVRTLRAVRQALTFNFQIEAETRQWLRAALPRLNAVSAERVRDELFRIFDSHQPVAGLRALEMLGALPYVLPELEPMRGVRQSHPHTHDVWNHTLALLQNLDAVLRMLGMDHDPEAPITWALGMISVRLGRYRQAVQEFMRHSLNPERSHRALLLFSALYHDAGKPRTSQVEAGGRIRFFDHEEVGAEMVASRGQQLHLSRDEIERAQTVVRYHMRPLLLGQSAALPSGRAVYRYYRATGAAGVDICLLSLADVLATYGPGITQPVWVQHLDVIRALLEGWWERSPEQVTPPALLDGDDLIRILGLKPGRQVGELLEAVREAQAAGEVMDRTGALALARRLLEQKG